MVDVWLLFNLVLPFIVVLLHTYMDTLRNDDEREINHHGKAIAIDDKEDVDGNTIKVNNTNHIDRENITGVSEQVKPAHMALVSVNEQEEMKAQKAFYDKIEQDMGEQRSKKLAFWKKVSLTYIPYSALTFVVVYWFVGLRHSEII